MLGDRLVDYDQSSSTTTTEQLPPSSSIPQHWKDLPLNILSAIPLSLGLYHWNQCDSIPLLPLYLVCYGGVNVFRSVVSFFWKVPRDIRKMDERLPETKVVRGMGPLLVCVAVWGAVVTLRDVTSLFPTGGESCPRVVYLSGLLSSVGTLAVLMTVLLLVVLRAKCFSKARANRDIRYIFESYYSSDSEDSSDLSYIYDDERRLSF
jgi:hypothetical protein